MMNLPDEMPYEDSPERHLALAVIALAVSQAHGLALENRYGFDRKEKKQTALEFLSEAKGLLRFWADIARVDPGRIQRQLDCVSQSDCIHRKAVKRGHKMLFPW